MERYFLGTDAMLKILQTPYLLFRVFCAGLFFCLVFGWTMKASAHIEKGTMPDSVAEMEYRILLDFEPDNHAIRNRLGMVLVRKDKLEEAEQLFQQVLDKEPANFDAMEGLGQVALKREAFQQAIAFFKKAVSLDSKSVTLFSLLGQAYAQSGSFDEAVQAYETSRQNIASLPEAEAEPRRKEIDAALAEIERLKGAASKNPSRK